VDQVRSPKILSVDVAPGVALNVRCLVGASASPAFVLVHGLSSNARLWDMVAAEVHASGHDVYAIDLRSHGESTTTDAGADTATAAADVAAVMEALGLGPAVVAGQSWGGNVVARLAARHPERVAALALVDGGWLDPRAQFDSWELCEAQLRPPSVAGRTAEYIRGFIRASHPNWSEQAVEDTLANLRVLPDGTVERRLSIEAHMAILRSMWESPPWPDLAGITVPVLLVPAVPTDVEAAARKRALVDRAEHALVRGRRREYLGGDHDLHAEQPSALAADLLSLAE
jgi:pimeloyl-ACP methyl ester carboxylesterase